MSSRPPPVALPLAPPRLTRNEAEGRSLIAQHMRQREVTLGDTVWSLTLEPLARDAAAAFGANDWTVMAAWAGAPFELRLSASAADQWMKARMGPVDLPAQLPAPVQAAAFEAALQDALDALSAAGQGDVRIDGVARDDAPSSFAAAPSGPQHQFALVLACGGARLWGTLTTDALGLMLMAGLAAHHSPARGPVSRRDMPVLLRAAIGTATLTRAELQSLTPGDAVVLSHSFADNGGQIWLGAGGWGLRVRPDGGQLVVTQPLHMTEAQMTDDLDGAELDSLRGDDAVTLDALPVRLQFDLGQRTMPLAQVSELQVGQVLDLGRPLSQAVNIRANGALIGTGELMEIGGRIAVGITSLGPAQGSPE